MVHGGQSPIVGAQVYLLAANTTGYGAASVSLLTSGTGRTLDTNPGPTDGFYYVTTDSTGSFTITGDYSCTANTQVYVYALGGNPGAGTNSAAGLMAALGNCPGPADNFQTAAPFLFVNEVSTVAAAYAMAGFATDALHVSSSGTAAAKVGIANAFVNASMLETLSTGVANAAPPPLPAGSGGGAVPQTEINTLGNILAACVNSIATNSACTTLFANAESGGTTGTLPTDTATAAINIAHNPVAAVATLYGLASAYEQFSPALTAQPNDFTVSIYFGNGLFNQGGPLAIDAPGNIWIAANSITKLNPQGYDYTDGNGYTGFYGYNIAIDVNNNAWVLDSDSLGEYNSSGTNTETYSSGLGLSSPGSIAMDSSSNAWIGDPGTASVVKVSSSGTLSGSFTGSGLSEPGPVAIDASGDAWIADRSSGAIVELSPTGSPLSGASGYTAVGLNEPTGIAIDHSGNVWVSNSGAPNGSVTEISKTGTLLSGSGYTNSALSNPVAIAIDGAGNAWVAGDSTTSEISPTGTFLSGSTGFLAADGPNGFSDGFGIAVDGSGDVWLNYDPGSFLFGYSYYMQEIVGAATPVVTPISLGVKNNTLGTRP
jgi:sugar lactone lactonase YvrE